MPKLIRPAAAPKLAPLQVALVPAEVLDEQRVCDDELVTQLDVRRADLEGVTSEFAELESVRISSGSMAVSKWRRANWVDVEVLDLDAANASFDESGWHRTSWRDCRLTGLGLAGCTLQDVTFRNCRIDMANLRYANLQRVHFIDCVLDGADFAHSRLQQVHFESCTFSEARFDHAAVKQVLIDGGSLSGITGIEGLRGASIRSSQIHDLAREMAGALGLSLVE